MNCASYSNGRRCFVLAGQESHCQLYHVGMQVVSDTAEAEENGEAKTDENHVRKRRSNSTTKKDADKKSNQNIDKNSNTYKTLEFSITTGDSVQTDFGGDEPLQRVVRVSNNSKLVATAGTDGHVRLWSFPALKPLQDIEAHSKEVDDLDFSPDDKWIVSISKDGAGTLWDCATGNKVHELKFGIREGDKKSSRLFLLANPARRSKQSSFLQLWNPSEATLVRSWASNENLCALAVNDDGKFVAVGTMFTGSVHVFVSFSLQRVLHVPAAHAMFVTGLSFLPSIADSSAVMGTCTEAAVVSISVDNQVCIHSVAERGTIPAWAAILLIIIVLFFTFALCSYLGL
ncbi:hypothetical protein B566_EDAN001630 [Ephemera danica]|nr:hypothetical protein B566_EDAN001630 [Ephemera danica]